MEILSYLKNQLLSFKLPFLIFAIIIILFLSMATIIITYKTGMDVCQYLGVDCLKFIKLKYFIFFTAFLIGIATVIQSGPIIFDKLIYWGQAVDNFLNLILFGKKFFLDEIYESLEKMRNLINQTNLELQNYMWELRPDEKKHTIIFNKIDELITGPITKIRRLYCKISILIKYNEAMDKINRQKKAEYHKQLNSLLIQTTEIIIRANLIKKKIWF